MPTISDLYRMREGSCRSFALSSAAIASDYSDRGMSGEPGLGCRRLTIWQQTIRRLSRLQMILAYR
jgi:hypothetical protein